MSNTLSSQFPWTKRPLIVNAPMGGFAGSDLATAVSKAGGLGMIGIILDFASLEAQLEQVSQSLGYTERKMLPIGVGLLPFVAKLDQALPILSKYPPTVVWLFAAKELTDYKVLAEQVRTALPETKVWIQCGSVSAGLKIAKEARPDALVFQGSDAGGHGFEKGASIVSLLPEGIDKLVAEGFGDIPVLASGGIADGRGAAAALVLGAQGVVMGTRFLAAKETVVDPRYQAKVLAATDGGQSTVRSKIFDELKGPNIWPGLYDGRSIVTESYADLQNGVSIDQIRAKYATAVKSDDRGWGTTNRETVWAGASVGLVNQVEEAAKIVQDVRLGINKALETAKSRL